MWVEHVCLRRGGRFRAREVIDGDDQRRMFCSRVVDIEMFADSTR